MNSLRNRFFYGVGYVFIATGIWGLLAFGVVLATLITGWVIQGIVYLIFISIHALQRPGGIYIAIAAVCFGGVAAIQAWASDKGK